MSRNIKSLVRAGWYTRTTIERVQDNSSFSGNFGPGDTDPPLASTDSLPQDVMANPPSEFERPIHLRRLTRLHYADTYAKIVAT